MAIPILKFWKKYYENPDEGLGSSYERIILNNKLMQICKLMKIESVLEAPSFGFTGLSGINSMEAAKNGKKVTIVDHDKERIDLIKKTWASVNLPLETAFSDNYSELPFDDGSFDLSWNFSALWFVRDLEVFLSELDRVTRKVILICVPNRAGIGFLNQKYTGKNDLKKYLKEEFIIPRNFKKILEDSGWQKMSSGYIDCPPWPDIGMAKEDFLKKFGIKIPQKDSEHEPVTVMDYYSGKSPDFPEKMMKLSFVENNAPELFKMFWAHHRYFFFVRK
ncbi:MAG: hypothetical protein CSB55_06105 [Candidatus Cloacimonadota bacterium]|nr:MAG: hypothetical protein CSB55_06105 [Candidatus Cloacimonadota bacterium]